MAKKTININQPQDFINVGSAPNSKDGDSLRAAFARLNDAIDNIDSNFSELYTAVGQPVDGNLKTDIVGSVFGDDSSLLVDGVMNRIVGPVYNAVGNIKITGGTVGQVLRTDGNGNLSWVTASQSGITASSSDVLTNKTINIQAGQGNVFQIQGNSITSYSGSGAVLALTSMPTFSGMNVNNSSLSMDGGSGSYYWAPTFADGAGTIHKAGVYKSAVNSNNALFSFGANSTGNMSVAVEGSLFVGNALPANNGGLNTDYGGWLVVQAGAKFGGDLNTIGNFILDTPGNYVRFGDGTTQTTAADFGYLDLDKDTIKGTAGYQYTFATDGYFTASTSSESTNYFFVAYNATNTNIAAGWTVVGGTANTTVSSVTYPVAGYPGVIQVNLTAAASSTSGFYPVTVASPDRLRVEIQPNPGTSDKFAFTTSDLILPNGLLTLTSNGYIKGSADQNVNVQTSYNTIVPGQTITADDSQGGITNNWITVLISGGGTNYPGIVAVQPGWTVTGTGLTNEPVTQVEQINLGGGTVVYKIYTAISSAKQGYTYNFTAPATTVNTTKTWTFKPAGDLVLPGNIQSQGNINLEINLTDSTLRRWQFGEDGGLRFPDNTSQTTAFTGTGNIEFRNDTITDLAGMILSNSNQTTASTAEISIPSNVSGSAVLITNNSKSWAFENDGSLIVPGDIQSDSDISVRINLADSTQRVWRFGEDGNLEAPGIVSAAGLRTSEDKIRLGVGAGQTNQGGDSVAVGSYSGSTNQGLSSVAVGTFAGWTSQASGAIAVGQSAGLTSQGLAAVAIGGAAGANSQGQFAVAIGYNAGETNQPANSIVINASGGALNGAAAGFYVDPIRNIGGTSGVLQYNAATKEVSYSSDIRSEGNINIEINLVDSTKRIWRFGEDGNLEAPGVIRAAGLKTSETTIALGNQAGATNQAAGAVAVGNLAGNSNQGTLAVAVGAGAGASGQGANGVAIGLSAAQFSQSTSAVAIGEEAGKLNQGLYAVAIGRQAGFTNQGNFSVALGVAAGYNNTAAESIVINGSNTVVNSYTSGLFINPIRNVSGTSILAYNDVTKEITHSNTIRSETDINIDINLSDSTLRRWRFGEDGHLTFPDSTTQATAFTGNAATVDVMNTNGIDYNYSITFVENRSATQDLRADVDLTFNSWSNTLTAGNVTTGVLKIDDGVHEKFQTKADATGVVTHDCASGHVFYHTSPDANWTVNLTNLNLSSGYATAVTLIIVQGGTGYYPSAVQIGGVAQTLNWQSNATPTPSTNRIDVVTFSIINNSNTYTVLGQLTGF